MMNSNPKSKTSKTNNMKHLSLLSIFILLGLLCSAQQSLAFPYQALVRDATGNPVTNQQITAKITLMAESLNGQMVFEEEHTKTTNGFGQLELQVGSENPDGFDTIPWNAGPMFIKLEVDLEGGTDYQEIGTHQLLAVPYAKYAEEAAGWKKDENGVSYNYGTIGLWNLGPLNLDVGDNYVHFTGNAEGKNGWLRFRRGGAGIAGHAGIVLSNFDTKHFFLYNFGGALKFNSSDEVSYNPNFQNSTTRLVINHNGNVGIGFSAPAYKLHVDGQIVGSGFKYSQSRRQSAFKNSEILSIGEVDEYIRTTNQLPRSDAFIEEDTTINLKKFNNFLLTKIEELTLYTIQQQKEIEAQKIENAELHNLFIELQSEIKNLKNK